MSELSGTLEGVGLPAIVRFLIALKKTGCLSVTHDGWQGQIFFSGGEVTSASFGSSRGLYALDAVVEALPCAAFEFDSDAPVPAAKDLALRTDELLAHLEEVHARIESNQRFSETNEGPAVLPVAIPPRRLQTSPAVDEAARCPKLGFEDDRSTSFSRPTRLHRCFAVGTPLPLSLDQQRELCISGQYATCPRLEMAASGSTPAPASAETDKLRIVRLPVADHAMAAARETIAERRAVAALDRADARSVGAIAGDVPARPTPLRSRADRTSAPAAADDIETTVVLATEDRKPVDMLLVDAPGERRISGLTASLLAGVSVVAIVAVAIGVPLLPHLRDVLSDQPTVVPTEPAATAASQPTPGVGAGNAGANRPAAQPTLPPEPTAAAPSTRAVLGNILLDERFDANARNWPSSPQGTAVLTSGGYHMLPRVAGQFVAVGAPIASALQDVVVSATFHKLSGPVGGGYGIIVRDQAVAPQNGTLQNGKYYVLEVGDKGEVGIWRRDGDRWVDLLPWQHADAVKPGSATNDVMVRAIGNRFSLSVNGIEVATRTDNALSSGLVGLFVGGDGNQVSVDRFTIQTP